MCVEQAFKYTTYLFQWFHPQNYIAITYTCNYVALRNNILFITAYIASHLPAALYSLSLTASVLA